MKGQIKAWHDHDLGQDYRPVINAVSLPVRLQDEMQDGIRDKYGE